MYHISLILCVLHNANSLCKLFSKHVILHQLKNKEYGNAKKLFYGIVFPEKIKVT